MNVAGGDLNWIGTLNDSQFQASLNRMERGVNRTTTNILSQGNQIENYARRAAEAVGAFASIQALSGFTTSLVQIRSQFQQLDIAFSTMLKSKAAADTLMKELIVFAGTTPFGLKDAAGAAKQLLAYGSTAKIVVGELRMLGDVASGVSVPIGDLVYLYGTLKTQGRAYAMDIRQFAGRGIPIYAELAKVLKVGKDEVAGLVTAGKVGFPQVEQAFKNMTAAGSMFGGLMEQQSKAWAGQIERFKDAWDVMLNDIGKSQEGLFALSISSATEMVENYKEVLDILGVLIYTYGTYRVALMAYSVAQMFATASVVTHGLAVRQLGVIETLVAAGKRILISLQATYNAVLAASPIGATVALLAALGAVIYSLTQYMSAAEASQIRFNTIQEESGLSAKKEEKNIKSLIEVIKSHTATNEQREAAYKKLQAETKGVLIGFSQEEIAAGKAKGAIDKYVKSIKQAAVARSAFSEFQKLNDQMAELDVKGARAISMMDKAALRAKGLGNFMLLSLAGMRDGENAGVDAQTKAEYEDARKIFFNGPNSNEVLVKKEKEKIQAQLKDLMGKFGNEITGELVKGAPGDDLTIAKNNKRTITAIDAEISKLKEEQTVVSETSAQFNKYQKEITKLEAEKAKITGKQSASQKKELSDREKFLNQLLDIEQAAFRKGLTKDQEEIKATQDKAESLRKEARKYGLGAGVITRIDNIEIAETGDINYRYQTEQLQVELDKQKNLYEEYESFKDTLGKDAADARFKKELDLSISYLEELQIREQEILSKGQGYISGPEQERLKVIKDRIKIEVEAQQKKHDELVKGLISYEQERRILTENYNSEFAKLEQNGDLDSRIVLTENYKIKLKELDDSNVKKLDSYKVLFEGIERLSDQNARKVIDNAKKMLASLLLQGRVSKETATEIGKLIKDSDKALNERLPERMINLANQIDQVANSVSNIDEAFGKVLSTVGNVVGQVGNIKKGMADFKSSQVNGDALGQLSAGLGIFGAGLSIFQSVFSAFDKSKQREEQAAYAQDLQNKQTESLNKALERQISLLDEVYGTERIKNYDSAIREAQSNEEKYLSQLENRYVLTGDKITDKMLAELNNLGKLSGGFGIGKVEAALKENGTLLPKDIASLQTLLDEGKLDAGTATIVENLIKANQAATDLKNNLRKELTGTSIDQLADDFISTLTDGTQDFGKTFEQTIQKSIINGFKGEIVRKQLQAFYDKFSQFSEGGLSAGEVEALRIMYLAAGEKAKKELEELEKVTGISLGGDKSDSNSNSLNGAYSTASQESISLLAGQTAGMRVAQLETNTILKENSVSALELLNVAKSNLDSLIKIEQNTLRTANNTNRLEKIEVSLSSIERKMGNDGNALKTAGLY